MSAPDLYDLGYYDPEPTQQPPCGHESTYEATTYPIDRTGLCRVLAVCEDCGEQLGQTGWDSVL